MVNEKTKIDATDEPIIKLLAALKHVEAPKDFDFRVKARIAQGRPAERQASWIPATVRYAVPLALAVAIGGYVGINSLYSPEGVNVPVVAVVPATQPIVVDGPLEQQPAPPKETVAERVELQQPEAVNKTVEKKIEKAAPARNPKIDAPAGGSFDSAIKPTVNLSPANSASNSTVPDARAARKEKTAAAFLTSAGISASFAGAGGRIRSVGGAAAAAGVKPGDVIESIDVEGGSIRIRRDGKSLSFAIR